MTRDEIDELMRENGIVVVGEAIYALVQLVIERDREACAKVCDDICLKYSKADDYAERVASQWCAEAIRARGEK